MAKRSYECIPVGTVGRGAFGEISKVELVEDGTGRFVGTFAMKSAPVGSGQKAIDSLKHEMIMFKYLERKAGTRDLQRHHVVNCPYKFEDEQGWRLLMTLCDGSLADLIRGGCSRNKHEGPKATQHLADDTQFTTLSGQIGKALAFLHSCGVIHYDVKPDNILYRKARHGYDFYLTDLGIADFAPSKTYDFFRRGTPLTYSPEMARRKPFRPTYAVDMYSLGVTLLMAAYLVCSRCGSQRTGDFRRKLQKLDLDEADFTDRPTIDRSTKQEDETLVDLARIDRYDRLVLWRKLPNYVRDMMEHDPSKRLTAKQLADKFMPA